MCLQKTFSRRMGAAADLVNLLHGLASKKFRSICDGSMRSEHRLLAETVQPLIRKR